uniref:Molecular chaperone (Small heat shock protein) n=1 Tax=Desulfovibrio sp. U5L TaxID=596152 RepID=I2Q4D6_9BACT
MPDLKSWGVRELSKLKDDLDRRIASVCEDFGLAPAACPEGGLRVAKRDGEWIILCPLPGFTPGDVAVTVTGRVLSIEAVRKRDQGGGMVRISRELALPFPIDQARANLADGVLTVRLARQAPPEARTIPVAGRQGGEEDTPAAEPAGTAETAANDRSTR